MQSGREGDWAALGSRRRARRTPARGPAIAIIAAGTLVAALPACSPDDPPTAAAGGTAISAAATPAAADATPAAADATSATDAAPPAPEERPALPATVTDATGKSVTVTSVD